MCSLKLLLVFVLSKWELYLKSLTFFMIARVKTPKVKLFFQMQTRLLLYRFILLYISLFMFPMYVFMQSSLILNTFLGNKVLFHM